MIASSMACWPNVTRGSMRRSRGSGSIWPAGQTLPAAACGAPGGPAATALSNPIGRQQRLLPGARGRNASLLWPAARRDGGYRPGRSAATLHSDPDPHVPRAGRPHDPLRGSSPNGLERAEAAGAALLHRRRQSRRGVGFGSGHAWRLSILLVHSVFLRRTPGRTHPIRFSHALPLAPARVGPAGRVRGAVPARRGACPPDPGSGGARGAGALAGGPSFAGRRGGTPADQPGTARRGRPIHAVPAPAPGNARKERAGRSAAETGRGARRGGADHRGDAAYHRGAPPFGGGGIGPASRHPPPELALPEALSY